jgi:GMP synthase (glutamine-hydrolysing)
MTDTLRFLIIDGYSEAGRDQLNAGGATTAGELYRRLLARWSPLPTDSDTLYHADDGVVLPDAEALRAYDGIAWTGSSLCLNDDVGAVHKQIQLAKDGFASGVPSFGSCWAAQIACVATGGSVCPNPKGREQGIARKIALNAAGLAHPMFEGKPRVFDAFASHDDHIDGLGVGTNLCGNAWTPVQAVEVIDGEGVFWAIQYHPEYDLYEMARLVSRRVEKLIKRGFFRNEAAVYTYIDDLDQLHADPTRRDLAWKLGIDSDIEDESIRCVEVKNWITKQVIPKKLTK